MKKTISILLVFVLLISSLCPTSVFAAMENTNLDWTNTTNWIFNDGSSKNIGTNAGAVAYTGGSGVTVDRDTFAATRGTTLKLDSGGFYASLPLNTEKNTDYKLTFSYCSTVVANSLSVKDKAPYAFNSAGIFIPNHPEFKDVDSTYTRLGYGYAMTYLVNYASNYQMYTPAGRNWDGPTTKNKVDQNGDGNPEDGRKYDVLPNFHNIEVNTWYTLSYNFNSSDFEDIAFVFQKVAGGNMWIDDIILEKEVEDNDDYFEEPSNWAASVQGSKSSPCKNILVDGISDTTVATAITWANYSNSTETVTGNGSSLLIDNPNHVSHIKLPDIETGATYRLKFAYKPTGGNAGANVLNFVGIFDPEFTQSKIKSDSTRTYSDLKTGFVAVDGYTRLSGKRYRFENGVYESGCDYASVSENTYTDEWRETTLYFTAKENLDNLYLLISYTTEAGKLLVDGFEFEKVEKVPDVIETLNSASIRAASEGSQGIRVNNRISKAEITKKNIVSYGAIAIRTKRMDTGVTLTLDTQNIATGIAYNTALTNFGGRFNEVVNPPRLRYPTDGNFEKYNYFSCVLIGIPERYYGDKYSVRSFAIDGAGNVYYGEVVEVSVFDVVRTILDPETPNASVNDKATANNIVQEIIDANQKDNSIPTYEEWLSKQ